jgi:predicted phage-related endonuclease
VISLHGFKSVNESIVADETIDSALSTLDELKKTLKTIQESKESIEASIKSFMGPNENLLDKSGKILATWKPTAPSKRFDAAAFKKTNEEEYSKFVKLSESSRRFCIKENNDEGI